jgi:hypothetical protein
MNGEVSMSIEVFSDYVEPGITMPENYSLLVSGTVNTLIIDRYTIQYTVLDNGGVTAKIMTRIVDVVDTEPPTIEVDENTTLFFGPEFTMSNIYSVTDNYCGSADLIITSNYNEINPNSNPGVYTITLRAEDSSGNISETDIELELILDYFHIADNLTISYSDPGIREIEYDENGPNPGNSCWIRFYNGDILNINEDGDFWIVKTYNSIYSGLIFFSGNFSNMEDTSLSISISIEASTSSWLRKYHFDASLEYEELDLSTSTFQNGGNVNYNEALSIFNEYGLITINRLKSIYTEIFRLNFPVD